MTCIDENRNKITNTNTLSIGEHNITCIVTTGAGNSAETYKTITIKGKDKLENKTYTIGEAVSLGGYNWHVIGDAGTQVTLLMDAKQLGDNSSMKHVISGLQYIMRPKVQNIYGGYLMSELDAIGKASNCSNQVNDKVRLITYSEYYNMSPFFGNEDSKYPNVENITKATGNYISWLYCNSNNCWYSNGSFSGYWWIMTSFGDPHYVSSVFVVSSRGGFSSSDFDTNIFGVRPVITIVK